MARLKDQKPRTASSRAWLTRQISDPYVTRAKREGLRSRAAYKLAEIDERHKVAPVSSISVPRPAAGARLLPAASALKGA
jgi:23S rRNA (uridine2552-2'-O)-methyltransferase